MEILNTVEHVGQSQSFAWGVILIALAIVLFCMGVYFVTEGEAVAILPLAATLIFVLLAFGAFNDQGAMRHEVRIAPGTVIDAQKYKVVETRGSIVVIEELHK